MQRRKNLLFAWLAPSIIFALLVLGWMCKGCPLYGEKPPLQGYFQVFINFLSADLIVQFLYSGAVYFLLVKIERFSIGPVLMVYVVPVETFSYWTAESYDDRTGTISWLILAVVVAIVSWFFASGRWSQRTLRH